MNSFKTVNKIIPEVPGEGIRVEDHVGVEVRRIIGEIQGGVLGGVVRVPEVAAIAAAIGEGMIIEQMHNNSQARLLPLCLVAMCTTTPNKHNLRWSLRRWREMQFLCYHSVCLPEVLMASRTNSP